MMLESEDMKMDKFNIIRFNNAIGVLYQEYYRLKTDNYILSEREKYQIELIKNKEKELEDLKDIRQKICNEELIEQEYVKENFVKKDKIKPIQIIDLDGKIHNVYKIEEE